MLAEDRLALRIRLLLPQFLLYGGQLLSDHFVVVFRSHGLVT